jgi:8-oxo-dGTP pyrophosphatase MutT (NUDIX family)
MLEKRRFILPRNAKRVFKGKIFEVYQWRQKQFDGSYAIFEKVKRASAATTIAVSGNKILLTREKQPGAPKAFLAMPGGRIDKGESPLQAAKRELLEETGYASDDWRPFSKERFSSKIEWTLYWYIAKNCKKVSEPHPDLGEKIDVIKVNLDQFLNMTTRTWKTPVSELAEIKMDKKKKARFHKSLFS